MIGVEKKLNLYGYQQMMGQPQQQQRPQQMQMQYLGLKGRPVSSFDEVKATAIDFDGSIYLFPDSANKKIYTKQINLDGMPTYQVYELSNNVPIETNNTNFITRDEFNNVIQQIKDMLGSAPIASSQQQTSNSGDLASRF